MITLPPTREKVKQPTDRRARATRTKDKPSVLRGRKTRARTGAKAGVNHEASILLPPARAEAFCKTMNARFHDIASAEVVRDHGARLAEQGDARWYVRFLRKQAPSSLNLSLQTMQDTRAQRACDQAPEMEFVAHLDKPGWFWTIHLYPDAAGRVGVYETHPSLKCSCPDHQYTCGRVAILCKHQLLLGASLPNASPAPRKETTAQRRARLEADAPGDFGLAEV